MSQKILQVNFRFASSRAEYEQTVSGFAADFAAVPGCRWKIWLMNEAEREAGGIYLFDDDAAVDAMLAGELIAGVVAHPALSDFAVKRFDVLPVASDVAYYPPVAGGAWPDLSH
jgi:hypothetical protein